VLESKRRHQNPSYHQEPDTDSEHRKSGVAREPTTGEHYKHNSKSGDVRIGYAKVVLDARRGPGPGRPLGYVVHNFTGVANETDCDRNGDITTVVEDCLA